MDPMALAQIVIAVVQGSSGLLLVGLAVPLILGKIKRNRWYGVRLPEAFRSEERWLEINRYGGQLLLRLGIVITLMAGVGLLVPTSYWLAYAAASLLVLVGGVVLCLVLVLRYAQRTRPAG